jgi:hypothetical protein
VSKSINISDKVTRVLNFPNFRKTVFLSFYASTTSSDHSSEVTHGTGNRFMQTTQKHFEEREPYVVQNPVAAKSDSP